MLTVSSSEMGREQVQCNGDLCLKWSMALCASQPCLVGRGDTREPPPPSPRTHSHTFIPAGLRLLDKHLVVSGPSQHRLLLLSRARSSLEPRIA